MRYMFLVKGDENTEAGTMPGPEVFEAMNKYNEELIAAGVMLAAEGLAPSSHGLKVRYEGNGKTTVTDGPFTETKELLAGFWLLQVKSREEAIEWAQRAPFGDGFELEVRRIFAPEDLPEGAVPQEVLEKEAQWREANEKPIGS
ncbi:Uncharacterized conserved protein [Amycolatopsis xylanica]|uniref:Uncharacterized conserved protein n=1 Tax=Amycolatopsis xylanica TaxID=589385 RepID=A0A1H2V8B9_9PSEU|nr:YciI family protein [Amycolatopsis xylanica]SDW64586.1 Uncharacterized conserved protein [Amycolatopsis xylanica]